jgi:hypothetical protein
MLEYSRVAFLCSVRSRAGVSEGLEKGLEVQVRDKQHGN